MTNPGSHKPSGSKWPITALVAMGRALFMTRGGAASLVPLVRALIPVVVVVVAYRIVRGYVRSQILGQQPRSGSGGPEPHGAGQDGKVIDLCPRCGSYLAPGHRCAPRS